MEPLELISTKLDTVQSTINDTKIIVARIEEQNVNCENQRLQHSESIKNLETDSNQAKGALGIIKFLIGILGLSEIIHLIVILFGK